MDSKIINIKDMTDSKELLYSRPNRFFMIFIYIIIALLVIFFIWAYYSKIDVYVKSNGTIRASEQIYTIKNYVNGKVEKIFVEDGEYVEKNSVLYELNIENLVQVVSTNEEKVRNLEDELRNLKKYRESVETNKNLFKKEKGELEFYTLVEKYLTDVEYYNKKILETNNEISAKKESDSISLNGFLELKENAKKEVDNFRKYRDSVILGENKFTKDAPIFYEKYVSYQLNFSKLEKIKDEADSNYTKNKILYNSGAIPQNELEASQDNLEKAKRSVEQLTNSEIINIEENIKKLELEIESYDLSIKKQEFSLNSFEKKGESEVLLISKNKLDLLTSIDSKIKATSEMKIELENKISELELQKKDSVIRSEINGILNLDREISKGELLQGGQNIGTIIPKNKDNFNVQVYASNKDIAKIKIGQEIKFKILALPYKEYGLVTGKVEKISVDSKSAENSLEKFYLVDATMENKPIKNKKGEVQDIKVGMIVEGQIITGTKSLLTWFLEKLNLKS